MTDFTIREIQDLRELADPPAPPPERNAQDEEAEREAALANALALIAKFDREH
jgi:predicted DNA-binding transcriptional regulator YafY